ncbi:MAG TPA: AAA family ATPase, partial [Acidimicrobiales bacterium]|nr:AAA family ATPase [Acidimicrobiales bacterium]
RHVDVLADLAFLVMDLEHLGAADVGQSLLALYLEAGGDRPPPALLHYYCAQRALVRAGVAAVRAGQRGGAPSGAVGAGAGSGAAATGRGAEDLATARRLLALAHHHLEHGRIVLGVVSGAPGSGKTTVAELAGGNLQWPVLRTDEIRRELVDPAGNGPLLSGLHSGAYDRATTDRTYELLLERAGHALEMGQSVILDGTFGDARWRRSVRDVARRTSADLVVIECQVPLPVAMARSARRLRAGTDISGAGAAVTAALSTHTRTWRGANVLHTDRLAPGALADEAVRLLEQAGPHPDRPGGGYSARPPDEGS